MRPAAKQAGALRAARWAGRAAILIGAVLFVVVGWTPDPPWLEDLWRTVLVVMGAGCWVLTVLVGLCPSRPGEQGFDLAVGLVSLAFGLFSIFGATDEGGSDLFFELAGALLALGAVGLIVASAASKRRADRWRNTEDL